MNKKMKLSIYVFDAKIVKYYYKFLMHSESCYSHLMYITYINIGQTDCMTVVTHICFL